MIPTKPLGLSLEESLEAEPQLKDVVTNPSTRIMKMLLKSGKWR